MNHKEALEKIEEESSHLNNPLTTLHDINHLAKQALEQSEPSEKLKITGETSDGYHTFNELYEFRKVYNATLFNEWAAQGKYRVHKSMKHHDGELCFGGGWFIVVAVLPSGQISNHYEMSDWGLFDVPSFDKAQYEFDGHTARDVVVRLQSLSQPIEPKPINKLNPPHIQEVIDGIRKVSEEIDGDKEKALQFLKDAGIEPTEEGIPQMYRDESSPELPPSSVEEIAEKEDKNREELIQKSLNNYFNTL